MIESQPLISKSSLSECRAISNGCRASRVMAGLAWRRFRPLCFGLRYLKRCCYSSAQGPPIRVGFTENAGRGVFATRDIAAGELVLSAKPAVTHPALTSLGKVCSVCLRRLRRRVSEPLSQSDDKDNGWNLYCSQACRDQAKDLVQIEGSPYWSDFHEYCRENSLKFPLLVKRLACMVAASNLSPDVLDILYPSSSPSETPKRWIEERKLLVKALTDSGVHTAALEFLTDGWYAGVLARVHLNTFRVETISIDLTNLQTAAIESVTGEDSVGSAVYILPSMFNHSCDANVNISWPESAFAELETLRNIEAGEELYITYIDASMACDARRALLEQAYGFQCHCPRCLDGD